MAPTKPEKMNGLAGLVDLDSIPVTYTPTTHRISKAKKGKKVHVCEFGCGKVFTRAEHRKRHEANHRSEPLFKCTVGDCRKPFQRVDLLNRHLERQHGIQVPPSEGRRRRGSSATSSSMLGSSIAGSPLPAGMVARSGTSPSPSFLGSSDPGTPSLASTRLLQSQKRRGWSQPPSSWPNCYDMPPPVPSQSPLVQDFVLRSNSGADSLSIYANKDFYSSPPGLSSIPSTADQHMPRQYQRPTSIYASEYQSNQVPTPLPSSSSSYASYPQAFDGLGIGFDDQYASSPIRIQQQLTPSWTPGSESMMEPLPMHTAWPQETW